MIQVDEVVVAAAFVFDQAQFRPFPIDAIVREGQAGGNRVVVCGGFGCQCAVRGQVGPVRGGAVEHLEDLVGVVEPDVAHAQVVPFPGFFRPENGVVLQFAGRVHHLPGVLEALDQVVVGKELLV